MKDKNYKFVKYTTSNYNEWNNFVDIAKNSTFLFHRDFMEYHSDKFEDFSLLVYRDTRLIGLLPANKDKNTIYSHQGLSYGGFVIDAYLRFKDYLLAFKAIMVFLEKLEIKKFYFKCMPYIYNTTIGNEIGYVLSKVKAKQYILDSYYVIDNDKRYKPNRNRQRAINRANRRNLKYTNLNIEDFWTSILIKNLQNRYNVKPVHALDEIISLKNNFPENIIFYGATFNDKLEAGVVMFITDNVAHFQYSSGTENRTENGALDFLFHEIIKLYRHKKYISFGSSSTDKSYKIDEGLAYWKESFGANLITQDSYTILPEQHVNLNTVFK